MLDRDTKRQIDSARDILVGKVPDPKAQVEQITTALIYKFMDDMDRENEELGGKTKFLTGKLKQYSWGRLLSKELSGQERLLLYIDALTAFSKAEQIPELFRTIFKDAFLPYRDPETLNLFLKEINGFTYDHSEVLGNAFEYLLSILGSQGDAGQFRTPRHIIDFIVEVVNPKKSDKILDPACGTAGFLISAYKHIWRQNSSNYKSKDYVAGFASKEAKDVALVEIQGDGQFNGDKLTPDNRKTLGNNIIGYDISPDMVRLSLVNMYLHGFNTPQISEYDTLTYEDRWGDDFDVIFANPPFMTPKGGIRPHKRFQVQANRAEVLFVDYIAEHLTLKGCAGIIVPEGIIFQASNAYKDLRKMLLEENYLWAVVSLPAGVFNPYSGVKTSILFLDRERAKKNDNILFVNASNDGFDLGAQRRAINKNDLPEAFKIIQEWQKGKESENTIANWVSKQEILDSGDYNLTGDHYREAIDYSHLDWPIVKLGEIAKVGAGNSAPQKKSLFIDGKYPFCRTSDVGKVHLTDNLSTIRDSLTEQGISGLRLYHKGTILFPKSGASTFLNHRVMLGIDSYVSSHLATIVANHEKALSKFLYYLLCSIDAKTLTADQNYPSLKLSSIEGIQIPLPPLDVQEEIVSELDGYQRVIDGARQVVENWKPTIKINPDWEMVKLEEVSNVISGYSFKSTDFANKHSAKSVKITNVGVGEFVETDTDYLPEAFLTQHGGFVVNADDIVIALTRSIISTGLKVCVVPKGYDMSLLNQRVACIKNDENKIVNEFLYYSLRSDQVKTIIEEKAKSLMQPNLSINELKNLSIAVPSIAIQKEIVSDLQTEQTAVESAKKLIEIHEQKIMTKIAEVWGE